jgi:hypothetical protein
VPEIAHKPHVQTLAGFVGTTYLVIIIVTLYYFVAFDPREDPFADRHSARAQLEHDVERQSIDESEPKNDRPSAPAASAAATDNSSERQEEQVTSSVESSVQDGVEDHAPSRAPIAEAGGSAERQDQQFSADVNANPGADHNDAESGDLKEHLNHEWTPNNIDTLILAFRLRRLHVARDGLTSPTARSKFDRGRRVRAAFVKVI